MKSKISTILLITILISLICPVNAKAKKEAKFNPDNIISNHEFLDYNSMNLKAIQEFLEKHNGILKNYKTEDINGEKLKASKIIFNASQKYKINPQIILTLLQKEQTLITTPPKKPTQLKWATGFAAYDHRSPVERFGGFGIQVDRTAWRLKYYLEHPWDFRHSVGQTSNIDYNKVTPQTSATAALYNYTPHIRGNKLFFQIWQNWFAKENGELENGSLVKTKNQPGVWLIENKKRRPFKSKSVFLSRYDFDDVIEVSKKELENYRIGEPVKFPNYSLVQASLGDLFLLSNNQKRPISQDMFKKIGFHPEEIIDANKKSLSTYKTGKPITSPYPNGALLQNKENHAVFYVKDDIKHPIVDARILYNNYPYNNIIKVEPKEIKKYKTGEPIKFRDGTLLKTKDKNSVYLVSKNKIRPIHSSKTFKAFGFKWENILMVPEDVLHIHEKGKVFKLEDEIK